MKAILLVIGLAGLAVATERQPPSGFGRGVSPNPALEARSLLEKRTDCGDGTQCLLGSCCGDDSCAFNCCGVSTSGGGVGCDLAEYCDYASRTVFIGCCGNFVGGCTGTPTMITMATIYSDTSDSNTATATTTDDYTSAYTSDASTYSSAYTSDYTSEYTAPLTTTTTKTTTTTTTTTTTSTAIVNINTNTPISSATIPTVTESSALPTITEVVSGNTPQGGLGVAVRPNMGALAAMAAWFFL